MKRVSASSPAISASRQRSMRCSASVSRALPQLLARDRLARRFGVDAAHQLADVLHLPAPAFVRARAPPLGDGVAQRARAGRPRPAAPRAARRAPRRAPAARASPACSCVLLGRCSAGVGHGKRGLARHRPYHSCPPPAPSSMSSTAPTERGFAYTREQFPQLVEDALGDRQAARRQRCGGRGLRRRRPVGVGAQGRDRERRAQPRQVDRRHGLPRPAARQREHVRLLARRARADGAARPTTSPASPPKTRRPACPTKPTSRSATPPRATSTCSIRGPSTPTARPSSRAAARPRRSPPTAASPTRKAPACRRSSRTSTPATRAAFAAATRARATRSRSRRSLVPGSGDDMQRDAWYTSMRDAGRAGRARGRRPLRRRARAVAAGGAQGPDLRGAGAVRVDARRRACSAPTCRRPAAARCTASRASCIDSLGTAGAGRRTSTSTRTRTCRKGKGSAPFDDEGVATRARAGRRRRRGAGLLPVELFGAQARHAHHRPRRRLAQPDAASSRTAARRRPRRDAAASCTAACSSSS